MGAFGSGLDSLRLRSTHAPDLGARLMDILFVFLAGLFAFAALFVLVIMLLGFRPRKGTRSRSRFRGDGGTGSPGGDGGSSF